MANSLLTIDMITRKALAILENNLVVTRNVNRAYDDSFAVEGAKIGSTLKGWAVSEMRCTKRPAFETGDITNSFCKRSRLGVYKIFPTQ